MIALFQIPITNILKNMRPGFVCAGGALLICTGFAMLPWLTSSTAVIISAITWTLGEIVLFPSQLAMLIRLSGSNKGKSIGLYQMVFSLASCISPLAGTVVYSYNANLLWYLSGIFGVMVTLLFIRSEKIVRNNGYTLFTAI